MESQIVQIFQKYFDPDIIYLFGSYGTDFYHKESDIYCKESAFRTFWRSYPDRFGLPGRSHGENQFLFGIDLAYYAPASLNLEETFALQTDLASLTGRSIDLVYLGGASLVLQMQVIQKGKILYSSGSAVLHQYIYHTAVLFAQYIDDIAIIKKKVKKRGTIYAGDYSFQN